MIAYITGASSGLGAYTAQALADNGWTVVAGARSFTGETDGRMTRLPLDVTRDDSVRDFMERAKQIGAPDAVIHCAAVLCFGSCEETALADYARVMETNFLGMVRVNKQVLPLMREKDHDPGILVCILCRFSFRNRGSGSSFCSLSGSRYCSMVLFPGCADRGDKFSAGIQLSGKKSRF